MARERHNWLVHRIFDRRFKEIASEHLRGRLIDIGCGTKPYEAMLSPYVRDHVGVDLPDGIHGSESVDLFGSAYEIPADDESFDSAICLSVLEHLEEPAAALTECKRILRPGGVAVYSVPFIWHIHEAPRDFFRFSRYGIDHLFSKAGFVDVEITPLSGFIVTFGQELIYYLRRFHRGLLRYVPVIPILAHLIQLICLFLDRFDRTEEWTWMYVVLAKKP